MADKPDKALSSTAAAASPATTNPRGIPTAPFVDNVTDYVSTRADVEPTLRSFQEMISKYQFMELNTQRRAQGLRDKIPDIKKTLETVKFLSARKKVGFPAPAYPPPPTPTKRLKYNGGLNEG
ncbi:hypothetical protein UREG_06820 [Uncinocarpus reesii 1704]|uniref:Uncharacterized protein n=1 Tax=Uncinocarpus reesii (strain UAMH 1704) TaxID=336963 RepID=C4JW78_UNCRE|nr:uncharacterized protein UREG_06820 [Uncinocarpus reesii 1704]EEP81955.1 hypothetical protein UREG_06820 [Uncinocarpus reesii 1704]